MDKPSGLEYLLNWLGLDWPEGDEFKMWDLADDWHNAAKSLSDIDGDIDAAIAAVRAAYPDGSGGEAMIQQLQQMRSGPQAIDQLVAWFNHVGDSAEASGDSIQGGKIQFETLLLTTAAALLAEEAFPPTAPAEQAATIAISRVGARMAMRQLLKQIAENGLKDVLLTTLKNQWKRLLLHLVLDATIPAGVNLANQEAKVLSGHQDGINWGEVGQTAVVGLAGGLTGGFAGGLMQGWMRNLSSGMFRGLVSGITGGVTGTLASGLADMAYTGEWSMDPSALVAGAFWGAHGSLGGHHGPVEDGTAPHTRVTVSDEGAVPTERVSIPGEDGSTHVEPAGYSPGDHASVSDSGPGQHVTEHSETTHSSQTSHSSEVTRTQDNSMITRERPVDSQSGTGIPTETHSTTSHTVELHSETTNSTLTDHSGARADATSRPESPVAARSTSSAGEGVRASSTRPASTGDGSSSHRTAKPETLTPREESKPPTERPMAGDVESPGTREGLELPTSDPVHADKPFSAAFDHPVSETPHVEDVPFSGSRSGENAEVVVPNDISTIHDTPAPPEPATRAGLAEGTTHPGGPERPGGRVGDRPGSSPIRARSTGEERVPGESHSRPVESGSERPRELAGARSRGDDEVLGPNAIHSEGDKGTQSPENPADHTSHEQHHADHEDYAYTGGAIRPRDEGMAFEWAEDAYDAFRGSDRDVDDIAGVLAEHPREDGTYFSRDDIEQIKNHLFREEHPIRDYDGEIVQRRYDADPDIAEAWIRMRSGEPRPADLVLLEHELAESNFYRDNPGAIYQDAHAHANESHNWAKVAEPRTGERYDTLWGRDDGATDLLQPDPQRPERSGVPVRGDEGESRSGADDRQGEQQRPHGPTGGRDLPVRSGSDQAPGQAREGVASERGDRLVDDPDGTSREPRTGDHDDPASRPADRKQEEPQRDPAENEHHEDGPTDPHEPGTTERPSVEEAFHDHAETTDAGVSLHAQDPELSRLAARVPADDRYFTVDAHVTADGHVRIGEHRYTPEEFGDMLREHGWDGEKPIRMIGCDAAENGFAGRLANHLDTDVLAPTAKAWTDEHGRVYSSTSEKDANGNPRPHIPPDGEWHTTHPDGTVVIAGDDGFVPGTPAEAKHGLDHDPGAMRDAPGQNRRTIDPSDERLLEPLTEQTIDDRPVIVDENGVPHKIDGEPDSAAVATSRDFLNDQLRRSGELYDEKTGNGSRFYVQDDSNPAVPKAIIDGTDSITGTTADLVKVTWRDGRVAGVETFDATTSTRVVDDPASALGTLRNKLPDGTKYQADNSVFVAPTEASARAVTEAVGGDSRIRVIHPESGFDSAASAGESGARSRSGSEDEGAGSAHEGHPTRTGEDSTDGRPMARGDDDPGVPDGEKKTQQEAMREQVERANKDPEYFKRYYQDRGNYTVRHSKGVADETGYVPPHLVKDPATSKWIAENDAPAPLQPDYATVHDPVGPEGLAEEKLETLNSSAAERHDAISEDIQAERDLKSAREALKSEDTPENRTAVQKAEEEHSPLHREMSEKSEKFGETVAAEHAIPDHYEGAVPERLEGPANGNDQFDQVYKLPDGKYVVVECKSSVDTDLGARWTRDGLRVSQGRREYFLDILEEMRERGEEYPHELELADALEDALNDGDVDYILVQGQKNNGEYAGYVMKIFDISGRRTT
ncbi:WXG100-like domain-containing protein [Nocardia macrotermitis]|nr:hypothetical protein [Nocardia macrotermitis]